MWIWLHDPMLLQFFTLADYKITDTYGLAQYLKKEVWLRKEDHWRHDVFFVTLVRYNRWLIEVFCQRRNIEI